MPVPNVIVTEHEVANAGDLGQVLRDEVIGAEHPAAVPQGVLAQRAGRLGLAQPGQGAGQEWWDASQVLLLQGLFTYAGDGGRQQSVT